MAEADLRLLDSAHREMKDYAEVHLHAGTAEVMAHVAMLQGRPLTPGDNQFVQFRMASPLALAPGERFVVRAPGPAGINTTLGGGRILDTCGKRLRRNRPWTFQALDAMRNALDDPVEWAAVHLRQSAEALDAEALARRAKMPAAQVADALEALVNNGAAGRLPGGKFVHGELLTRTADAILAALDEFHGANPTRAGMSREDLSGCVTAEAEVFESAVEELLGSGRIEQVDTVLALPGAGTNLSDEDRDLCGRIAEMLQNASLAPPLPGDMAGELGVSQAKFAEMVALLEDHGTAVQLDRKVILHSDAVDAAKSVVLDLFAKAPVFTTMEFRDALGASRKVAVPLLDYLDTLKFTVRTANRRKPGVEARKLLADVN